MHCLNLSCTPQDNTTILLIIKQFFKCALSADSTTKILPIQVDSKVTPKTTAQITDLTLNRARNYFKRNRGFNKALAGDFHISTPFTSEDFKCHSKISSWLTLNGYRIILSNVRSPIWS